MQSICRLLRPVLTTIVAENSVHVYVRWEWAQYWPILKAVHTLASCWPPHAAGCWYSEQSLVLPYANLPQTSRPTDTPFCHCRCAWASDIAVPRLRVAVAVLCSLLRPHTSVVTRQGRRRVAFGSRKQFQCAVVPFTVGVDDAVGQVCRSLGGAAILLILGDIQIVFFSVQVPAHNHSFVSILIKFNSALIFMLHFIPLDVPISCDQIFILCIRVFTFCAYLNTKTYVPSYRILRVRTIGHKICVTPLKYILLMMIFCDALSWGKFNHKIFAGCHYFATIFSHVSCYIASISQSVVAKIIAAGDDLMWNWPFATVHDLARV